MSSIIQMPNLPKPSTTGTVRRWLKQEGDPVAVGEVFLEVETERSLLEIESSHAAVLARVMVRNGQTIKAGDALCEFTDSTTFVAQPKPSDEKKNMESKPNKTTNENAETVIPVPMPKAGNDMEEGTLVKWLVSEGADVKPGDVLFEIETDKATMEIESEYSGTIRQILVKEGETVAIHTPLAYLATSDATAAAAFSTADAPSQSAEVKQAVAAESEKPQPATRNLQSAAVTPILMPKAGNDMEEGTVVKWLISEGAAVKEGDVIFELETDKATMEIESEYVGTVRRIVVQEGATVPVHTPLAYIADSDTDVDAFIASGGGAEAAAQEMPQSQPSASLSASSAPARSVAVASQPQADGRIKASPAAKRLASERGINLAAVSQGSGPGGRIITSDLSGVAPSAAKTSPAAVLPAAPGEIRRYKMTPMRKAISKNLTASVQTAPHFYMRKTIEAVQLMEVYRRQKKVCNASLNDLIVLAIARTMVQYPAFRSRVEGEEVVEYPSANIGIAVGTDDGLRVPVVLNVDRMSLAQLAQESRKTIQMAREGKAVNMGKGNFTISNLGMFNVEDFTAIINPPEAAILAVGAALESVKVENGAIKPSRQMTITLSSDHRLIDGLMAARFLNCLQEILENPESLEK